MHVQNVLHNHKICALSSLLNANFNSSFLVIIIIIIILSVDFLESKQTLWLNMPWKIS